MKLSEAKELLVRRAIQFEIKALAAPPLILMHIADIENRKALD